MSRTHPPTLITRTTRTVQRHALLVRGERVLVAVSGGPDSIALLHVLAHLRAKLGHGLVAHAVDHGLRESALAEIDLARDLARALDVPFAVTRVSVARGGNLQARARAARYEALRAAAAEANASRIATAHHANDRAETVLLRILRGAGPRGLAVLPAKSGDLVRPFLDAERADIDAHVTRHHLKVAQDPSNLDPRFLRTRVRREVLPLLKELNPAIVTHLCALADQLAELAPAAEVDPELPHLPRPTQLALAALRSTASVRARVRLPGGRVARYDARSNRVAITPNDDSDESA